MNTSEEILFHFDGLVDHEERVEFMLRHICKAIFEIKQEINQIMSEQDVINETAVAEAADIQALAVDFKAISDAIAAERKAFEDFKAANPGVDVLALEANRAALDAATASISGVAEAIKGIVDEPAPPATPNA